MGEIKETEKVLLTATVFSRHEDAMEAAARAMCGRYGPVALTSELIPFTETAYYEKEMGADLKVRLLAFKDMIVPTELSQIKLETNQIEKSCSRDNPHPEPRPVNIDPGYITPDKLVVASTKDSSSRVAIGNGIYAQIMLHYLDGSWHPSQWTYPNYRREEYRLFYRQCRGLMRR